MLLTTGNVTTRDHQQDIYTPQQDPHHTHCGGPYRVSHTVGHPVVNHTSWSSNNHENWLAVDEVIAKIIRLTFFGPPCTVFCRYEFLRLD